MKSLPERVLDADIETRRHLANARAAEEAGHKKRAARLYEAAQKAMDRWTRLQERRDAYTTKT